MRNGYLNKSEEAALLKAVAILNKYCDWAAETGCVECDYPAGEEPPERYAKRAWFIRESYDDAANAAGAIRNLLGLHWQEEE